MGGQARIDPRKTNPFPFYDAEVRRIRAHLERLDAAGWRAASHCRGWSVKDVVSHLTTDEVYNQACLNGSLNELDFSGGLHAWNDRGVRARRRLKPSAVLAEWVRRQRDVRRRWGQLGLRAKIPTHIGRYPLRLQVWHLAREYAVHGDDIRVRVPERQQGARWRWRSIFGLFAARENGERVPARLQGGRARFRRDGTVVDVALETFVAFLADRPQHLEDPVQRRIVRRLSRG